MKKVFKGIILVTALTITVSFSEGQLKVHHKHPTTSTKTKIVKVVERSYGTPSAVTEITDVMESSNSYESIKNLIENYGVPITYADNTFKGKEILRRGDFVVALNAAFNSLKKTSVSSGLDTSLINTYDRNKSYVTSVSQIKDLKPGSIYYEAAQSLIEKWGVAAPFSKSKLFNAGSPVTETEVYDILKVTLGYNSAAGNSLNFPMTRDKFVVALNNALAQNIALVNSIQSMQNAIRESERRRLQDSVAVVENARKAMVAREMEIKREEAQKREDEARKKLKEKGRK